MNTTSLITESQRDLAATALAAERFDEGERRWFDSQPPRRSSSVPPPIVQVGEFLGDPEVDSWLR